MVANLTNFLKFDDLFLVIVVLLISYLCINYLSV